MPTPTDLVTDLPADFEVFGQAVDSSMADLKGGTSGQILAKNSNTDMDFVWIANDQGDITGITATSPLTGGGTSGAVTVGIQDGTTAQKGAVQLENSTSSTSTTTAAVPASVKAAYDLAAASSLTLVNSTTFSGASSVAIDNVFTSTYSNYFIQTSFTSSGSTDQMMQMRLRVGGVDATGSDYLTDGTRAYPASVAYFGGAGTTWNLHNISSVNAEAAHHTIQLLGPQLANTTKITAFGFGYTSVTFGTNSIHQSGRHGPATQYDGFKLFVTTGNIAGTVKIYGYKN
jgi:hypothetical protein